MSSTPPRSLRRAYVEWVEAQIEEYKETVPRAQLLDLADEVVTELRMDKDGQYQLTEILLCNAMDRRIFRMLKLPGYRAWRAQQEAARGDTADRAQTVISFPLPERIAAPPPRVAPPVPAEAVAEAADAQEVRLACVG